MRASSRRRALSNCPARLRHRAFSWQLGSRQGVLLAGRVSSNQFGISWGVLVGSPAHPARAHREETGATCRLARAAAPPLFASSTSQPPVDNRKPPLHPGSPRQQQKRQLLGVHTHHIALSPFPHILPVRRCLWVCWATASNLSSYDAQRLADTAGFDATARWGCNSHRPGAVWLLRPAKKHIGRAVADHPRWSGLLCQLGLQSGHVDMWRLECQTTRPLARPLSNTRPRHGMKTSPPLSSNLSVARVKTCRSLARHGGRQDTAADLWSEAQVS